MIYGIDERMEVRYSQANPCSGTYTTMIPEDREGARPLRMVQLNGMALAKGTYRLRIERVGDV